MYKIPEESMAWLEHILVQSESSLGTVLPTKGDFEHCCDT